MHVTRRWGKARFTVHQSDGKTREITVQGRDRWALEHLIAAGPKGCTPIEQPGPRWSGYTIDLRHEHGLEIETITEEHDGPFQGHHARYVLRSVVTFAGEVLQ